MSETNAANPVQQSILLDTASNCFYTIEPLTGQAIWVIDPSTGKPLTNRPIFKEPTTGRFVTTDTTTGQTVYVIDPRTGQPMTDGPLPQTSSGAGVQARATQAGYDVGRPLSKESSKTRAQTAAFNPNVSAPMAKTPSRAASETTSSAHTASATAPSTRAELVDTNRPTSAAAITSLVLGILAIATSFIPIINNASFFGALIGLVFAVIGIVGARKGQKSGQGIAIAGLILALISMVIVLATQSLFSATLGDLQDELEHGSAPVAVDGSNTSATTSESATKSKNSNAQDYSSLAIGQSVTLKDGLIISVDNVRTGLEKYDGSAVTEITVTYQNTGSKNATFNAFDWKAQDASGAIRGHGFVSSVSENELNSGELAPGGTVSGNVYFEGDIIKVYYYSNVFQSGSDICWLVS